MSKVEKIGFLLLAVVSMTCLALASAAMAIPRPWIATLLFIVAFLLIGCAFMARRRVLKR